MTHRALAAPRTRAGQNLSPSYARPDAPLQDAPLNVAALAAKQASAISLGVALRYLAVRRTRLAKPSAPAQRPVLRVVT